MKDPVNLGKVCALDPDFVGYIFFGGSKRYVGDNPDPELFRVPPDRVERVGVFVDASPGQVARWVEKGLIDLVQLHGSESADYCRELTNSGIRVIKAVDPGRIRVPGDLESYVSAVEFFLFDTPGPGFGGTGRKFDWSGLEEYKLDVPFMLGGGIGPGDPVRIRALDHPRFFGVDVNSRFEREPGVKETELLKAFIDEIRT